MALNFVRGFRRIGWVITFPLAAIIVLVFYENTKAFSPSNYEVAQYGGTSSQDSGNEVEIAVKGLAGMGKAFFSRDVPTDVVEKILDDFVGNQKLRALNHPIPPAKVYFDDQGNPLPLRWMFRVQKQVSKLNLAWLIAGSLVIPALIIQGFISVLAWIARGFKGDRA